jgi:hypothetical protein
MLNTPHNSIDTTHVLEYRVHRPPAIARINSPSACSWVFFVSRHAHFGISSQNAQKFVILHNALIHDSVS